MSSHNTTRSDIEWRSSSLRRLLVVASTLLSILATLFCWVRGQASPILSTERNNGDGIVPSVQKKLIVDRSLSLFDRDPTGYIYQFVTCEQQQNQQGDVPQRDDDGETENQHDSFVALLKVCELYNHQFGKANTRCKFYHAAAAEWVHFVGEFVYQRLLTDYCAVCDRCNWQGSNYNNEGDEWGLCGMEWSGKDTCDEMCDGQGYPTGVINTAESTRKRIERYSFGGREETGPCEVADGEMEKYLSRICVDHPPRNYEDLRKREKCHYDKASDWAIYMLEWLDSCDEKQGYPDYDDIVQFMVGHMFLECDSDGPETDVFGNRPGACTDFLQVVQQGTGPIQNIPSEGNEVGFWGESSHEDPPSWTVEDLSVLPPPPPLAAASQVGQDENNTLSSFKFLATAFVGGVVVTTVFFYASVKFKVVVLEASPPVVVEPQYQHMIEMTEDVYSG